MKPSQCDSLRRIGTLSLPLDGMQVHRRVHPPPPPHPPPRILSSSPFPIAGTWEERWVIFVHIRRNFGFSKCLDQVQSQVLRTLVIVTEFVLITSLRSINKIPNNSNVTPPIIVEVLWNVRGVDSLYNRHKMGETRRESGQWGWK